MKTTTNNPPTPVPVTTASQRSAAVADRLLRVAVVGFAAEAIGNRGRRPSLLERWKAGTPPKRARRR